MLQIPRPLRWTFGAGLLLLTLAAGAAAAEEADATRARMREIFARMEVLVPMSVDDEAFADPGNAEKIRVALAGVAQRIGEVGRHAGQSDRRVHYLAGSLEQETREALARFDAGRKSSAQFFVQRLTDFCVACHTRLPAAEDSPVAEDFVTTAGLAKLPLDRRATLQIATRRFDDGLTTLETLIDSSAAPAPALLDPVTTYLRVSIRVKGDLARPIPTLHRLSARPDLWAHLRSDVEAWIQTLERHRNDPATAPSLERIRAILDEARSEIRFPSDRRALVHYLLASAELNRYLEMHRGESGEDVAEAYYLLGLVESRVGADYWISEAHYYLETAVRLSPGTEIGRRAFELLEEEMVLGWSGSGGTNIPVDIQARLDELSGLLEAAREGGSDGDEG